MNEADISTELKTQQAALELARLAAAEPGFGLVLAESCTGGLIAASLTGVPGASKWFCGSSVVYQEATKVAWLKLSGDLIAHYLAESEEVTQAMSRAILDETPHASFSLATTGHLESDTGRSRPRPHVFVSIFGRIDDAITPLAGFEQQLFCKTRNARQQEATIFALQKLLDAVQTCMKPSKNPG